MIFIIFYYTGPCQKAKYNIGKQTYDSRSMMKIRWDYNATNESPRILGIYYDNPYIKISTTSELIDLPTFISNVGGNLGLFVGFSVLGGLFCIYDFIAASCCRLNIFQ
jgi:hypothetical protein